MLGRYLLADAIASGGMATVHLGRLTGPVGFARTVAIKRLHPQYAKDPEFVTAFLDEARLAARIQHPNVVATLDVVAIEGELFLVMEYVDGESLARLTKRARRPRQRIPPRIVSAVITSALYGLHAAHEARGDDGEPLGLVHRDVSPQNILVGSDGVTRMVDFGIAKADRRVHETEAGRIKGKFAYMAPEQVKSRDLDRRADVFAAGIVLWEALTGRRLFEEDTNPLVTLKQVAEARLEPPSRFAPELSPEVDAVVMRALSRPKEARFQTAREMAVALERAIVPALQREVSEWVHELACDALQRRGDALTRLQREESGLDAADSAGELSRALESDGATASYTSSVVAMPAPEAAAQTATTRLAAPQAAPPPKPPASFGPRAYVIGAVLGALLFAVLLIAGLSMRHRSPEPEPVLGASETGIPVPLPNTPPETPDAAAVALEPDATVSIDAAPAPSASARPNATGVRVPQVAKPNCQPPYWVDADGIKHYKRECNLGK